MGKRSRRREGASPERSGQEKPTFGQRFDVASRQAERRLKERPKAPWDPFPLTELAIFVGLVLIVIGALLRGPLATGLFAAGFVLAALGGLETVLREHLAGYRSHSGLLAAIAALVALTLMTLALSVGIAVRAAVAIGVFALVFPALRRAFIRKSGGRGVL